MYNRFSRRCTKDDELISVVICQGGATVGFLDHEGGVAVDYSKEEVLSAIEQAVPGIAGMRLERVDRITGHVVVKTGVSLFSWGENISLSVVEMSPSKSRISIISSPKTGVIGGAFDMGKNRRNIEKIIETISEALGRMEPTNRGSNPKERLQNLKDLLASNLISQDEYEKRKQEILAEI
jgi:hypothetical protein